MSRNNVIISLILLLTLSGCIGPLYNPYPISKLVARVGPPLKIGEDVNNEVPAITEDNQISSENNQEQAEEGDQTNETVASLNPNISIEKIDSKTVIASWPLVNNESLILTPAEIKSSIKEICENNRPGHLLSFSSSEGIATATFKCW